MNKDFFDNKNVTEIDRQIRDHLNRPTLVQQMRADNKKKEAANDRGLSFSKEFIRYWYVYVFLAISAMFTGTLGIYMGLSPSLVTELDGSKYIHFNTDVGHVLMAIVYLVAFVGVTELAFGIAKWKYYTREENNKSQKWLMITAMSIAGLSILGTGIAGGNVVASNISFLSDFVNVSPTVQKYVVIAIPVLIVLYTVLFSAYALSSDMAASERLMGEQERQRELDNRTRMNAIEQIAAERLQAAEITAFQKLVEEGMISSAQAMAAIRAGRSLKQEELFQGRDLDGDGKVGHRQPQTQSRPQEKAVSRCLNCGKPLAPGFTLCDETCESEYEMKAAAERIRKDPRPLYNEPVYRPEPRPTQPSKPEPSGSARPLYNEHTYHPVELRKNGSGPTNP